MYRFAIVFSLFLAAFASPGSEDAKSKDGKAAATTRVLQQMAGTWELSSRGSNGALRPPLKTGTFRKSILPDGTIVVASQVNKGKALGKIRIDPTAFPKTIDFISPNGRVTVGIYELDGDDLHVCTPIYEGSPRPNDFAFRLGSDHYFELFRRVKDKK
jgi:uncharacterized protein (TIGR03067 family)